MSKELKILVIEDSESDAEMITRHLSRDGVNAAFTVVCDPREIGEALRKEDADIVICDHHLPKLTSKEILEFRANGPSKFTPLILVSGTVDTQEAVELMRHGVADFISKDDLRRLTPAVLREVEAAESEREKNATRKALQRSNLELREALQSLNTAQGKLIAAEKFRALGQMAGGIAHDFNNSLTVLQGTMELMKSDSGEKDSLMGRMETQIADAATTVRRMREFYCEPQESSETAVEISQLLEEVKDFTAARWQNGERSDIKFTVDSRAGVYVWCDASKVREVLVNLVFNAIDAVSGEAQGRIVISSELSAWGVKLTVSDDGCGMSAETTERCLEALYTTKGLEGTGLGLAVVDSLVQSFGGRLSVESELGKGSSFSFQLKECNPNLRGEQPKNLKIGATVDTRLKIIVVDDEPIIATLVTRLLERLGHEVLSFHTAEEVVEEISRSPESIPDIVVSDRSMPEVSGDELARIIKEGWPTVKFVMASGFGDLMIATGERPIGVDLILAKPLSLSSLSEGLEILDGNDQDCLALPG
ncbi:MAG: response regulator [Verrucomicrobiales bacterium]|nr:response regulator [Verrucomicrobiales bacterium]